jgi:alpha-L-fucosidase
VEDVERGYRSDIVPHAWQTDTCIGEWHYKREIFEKKAYMGADAVIHRLCDVVAKNGNLLLSIPVKGDGTIDSEERRILEEVAVWNGRFGDAIFASRPWRVAGDGPTQVASGQFGEGAAKPFTAEDIRFTAREEALHAITLGPVSGRMSIGSLAEGGNLGVGQVARVEVVGDTTPLAFTRDGSGLHVEVPERASHAFGVALKLIGKGLVD